MAIRLFDEQGNTEKQGIVVHMISWKVDTLAECVGGLPDPSIGIPENFGKRRWKKWRGGGYIINATYEGIITETDPTRTEVGFYPSFKEAKLPTHPRFQQILKDFGGKYDPLTGVITWQPQLSGTGGGGFAGATSGGTGQPNPLFGQDSYIEVAIVFRRTRIFSSAPTGVLNTFSRIQDNLPGDASGIQTPPGRNWFVMPPTIERRGQSWSVADEWLLSPPGQTWSPSVYAFIVS